MHRVTLRISARSTSSSSTQWRAHPHPCRPLALPDPPRISPQPSQRMSSSNHLIASPCRGTENQRFWDHSLPPHLRGCNIPTRGLVLQGPVFGTSSLVVVLTDGAADGVVLTVVLGTVFLGEVEVARALHLCETGCVLLNYLIMLLIEARARVWLAGRIIVADAVVPSLEPLE